MIMLSSEVAQDLYLRLIVWALPPLLFLVLEDLRWVV